MCVAQTAKRRRKQARLDPRYTKWRKDPQKRAKKLQAQIETARRISSKGKEGKVPT